MPSLFLEYIEVVLSCFSNSSPDRMSLHIAFFRVESHCTRHFDFFATFSLETAKRHHSTMAAYKTEANTHHTILYSFTLSTFRL